MIKKLIWIFLIFLLLPATDCSAEELGEKLGVEGLYDSLPEEGKEQLSSMDVYEAEDSLEFSFEKLISAIPQMLREQYLGPLNTLLAVCAAIILSSFLGAYSKEHEELCALGGTLSVCALFLPQLISLISQAKYVCDGVMVFLAAAIPVYAGLHIAAGSVALGSTYGGVSIVAANLVSQLINGLVMPSLPVFLGLSVSSAFSHINIKGISDSMYKFIKWLMVFSVTAFSGIISVQSAVSGATDVATTKTVKLLASSAIPIVGSAFGEGVAAVQNSVRVLKSGAGAFGMIATVALFLSPIIQTLLWQFSCQGALAVCDLFGCSKIKAILSVFATIIKVILAVLMSLCIISLVTAAITLFFGA